MTRVRVRGIYATALTRRFGDAGFDVVAASPPIRERFDREFDVVEADVDVWMTPDRQGVGVATTPDSFESVRDVLADTAIDAFAWRDRAARGTVFDAADSHVTEDDRLRVQVHDPKRPWGRDRPVVGTDLRVPGAVASLERCVDSLVAGAPSDAPELARTTELLDPDVPERWGVRWHWDATDASVDAMGDAVDRAVTVAEIIEDELAAAPDPTDNAPALVVAPEATAWVWFGRESRFALDDARRDVTPTMPGHHRIKAGSDAASTAVDFAESLGATPDGFPFGAVTDQFGPTEGDTVAVRHGKPDGSLLTLGRGEVTDRDADAGRITVEREMTAGGTYDELGVERDAGDVATTRFTEGNWWYPTVYRSEDGTVRGTYLNVSTPVEVFPDAVRYVDLHVDVVKHADGTVEVVDEDELQDCVDDGTVSDELAEHALNVAERVRTAVAD